MLDELGQDVDQGRLYMSPQLSELGQAEYAGLLRQAIRAGTDATFADGLRAHGRMQLAEHWRLPRGGVSTRELPPTAPDALAEDEFHRFYARGLCRRALEEGISALVIYRAGAAPNPRVASDAMVGVRIDAASLLEDLRTPPDRRLPRGLPPCPDSGLSVRLP